MTDHELLELAAKAAELALSNEWDTAAEGILIGQGDGDLQVWNPLRCDGDALRLAVKLGLDLFRTKHDVEAVAALPPHVKIDGDSVAAPFWNEELGDDPCAATRRAIVRAAAEIGRSMS